MEDPIKPATPVMRFRDMPEHHNGMGRKVERVGFQSLALLMLFQGSSPFQVSLALTAAIELQIGTGVVRGSARFTFETLKP